MISEIENTVTVKFECEKDAEIAYNAMEPDQKMETWERAKKELVRTGDTLRVTVIATDASAFRVMNNVIADRLGMIVELLGKVGKKKTSNENSSQIS